MSLDPKFVIASGLQESFIDKTTKLPLANGVVTFYKDQARTILKPIYQLSGVPPYGSASYTALPNPLTLSSIGTIQDPVSHADIVPYYYPYDSDGNVELYYITVVDSGGAPQFTRQAWPNTIAEITSEQVSQENFCPNGQFLLHYITPDGGKITGASSTATLVAPGGWYYYRQTTSAVDYVTFTAFGSAVSNPTASPRYAANIKCVTPASDTYKYFGITFTDVNKFSSSSTAPTYTFSFTAKSNTGSSQLVSVVLDKDFGSGGSPEEVIAQGGSVTVTSAYKIFNIPITFGDNLGKTIGASGGDVSILIVLPATYTFDLSITDMCLVVGNNVNITQFPVAPDSEMQYQALVPAIPDPYGNDLHLPAKFTKDGLVPDHSVVGKIYPCVNATPAVGELLCDGTTYYTADYSSDGIPYQRLGTVIYDTSLHLPTYGTGASFVTASLRTPNTELTVSQNTAGTASAITNGTSSPGLIISPVVTGLAGMDMWAGYSANIACSIIKTAGAAFAAPSAGTSGLTINVVRAGVGPYIQEVTYIVVSALPAAGTYFTLSNTTTTYALWFKINGAGAAPSVPGATLIEIDLLSTYTTTQAAQIISQAISGFNVQAISCPAASTIPVGSYFNLYNTASSHFVYYFTIGGSGAAPVVAGARITAIALNTSDPASTVALAIIDGINKTAYATPDLRGDFIRFWDHGAGDDRGSPADRFSWLNGPTGDNIGSFELDALIYHAHSYNYYSYVNLYQSGTSNPDIWHGVQVLNGTTGAVGAQESRPYNFNVNAVIKY